MDILWIIIFILYMAYRAFSEAQKKQQQAQRRKVATKEDPGTRHYRYEDIEPKRELPWDFDPDEYQEKRPRVYRVEAEQTFQEEENIYQKKLKALEDKKRDRSKRIVDTITNEKTELVSTGFSIQLDNKSLVNAVIMSEILQPPRCKRPIKYLY